MWAFAHHPVEDCPALVRMTICIYHHHSKSRDGTSVSSTESEALRAVVSSVGAGWMEESAVEAAEAVVVIAALVAEAELRAALIPNKGLGRRYSIH